MEWGTKERISTEKINGEIDFEMMLRNLRIYLQRHYRGMKSWEERQRESNAYFANKQNTKNRIS